MGEEWEGSEPQNSEQLGWANAATKMGAGEDAQSLRACGGATSASPLDLLRRAASMLERTAEDPDPKTI